MRTAHEAQHLLEFMDEGTAGDYEVVDDLGFLRATLSAPSSPTQCAAIRAACWTGGHGGFGLSGLHGTATLTRNGPNAQIDGSLGLVDGNALVGAPTSEVSITISAGAPAGSVGPFEF